MRGVFNGASLLFFSYVGFDAIATTAEEVKNPGRDIPIGRFLPSGLPLALPCCTDSEDPESVWAITAKDANSLGHDMLIGAQWEPLHALHAAAGMASVAEQMTL